MFDHTVPLECASSPRRLWARCFVRVWLSVLLVGLVSPVLGDPPAAVPAKGEPVSNISPARILPNGGLLHLVRSPYQKGEISVRVLLPEGLPANANRPVLYVLPVEPGSETAYGDPYAEILRLKLHEKQQLICVFPTFERMPWYADHPTEPHIRQESHFLKVIVPLIEQTYPVQPGADGRWLLGFSKGGWGAFSLLLRHPDAFDRAAAWDVPFLLPHPDRYGMAEIFGTQENFEHYRSPRLLEKQPEPFRSRTRLVLMGYNLFREHQQGLHGLLDRSRILHRYQDGPRRPHRWDSGWLPDAISLLSELPARERNSKLNR